MGIFTVFFSRITALAEGDINTGKDKINEKKTVPNTVQTNKLICSKEIDLLRKFLVVHIKLIPPKIELNPAQYKLKIAKSTLLPG